MYPNYEAERARAGLTLSDIAEIVGGTVAQWSSKLSGNTNLTFDDAVKLKKAIKTDVPLEELFERRKI